MPPASLMTLTAALRGDLVPVAIGGADAGAVRLEADLDRLRALRLRIAHEARRKRQAGSRAGALERGAAEIFDVSKLDGSRFSVMPVPLFLEHWPNVKMNAARAFRTAENRLCTN